MKKIIVKKLTDLTRGEKEKILSRSKIDFAKLEKEITLILDEVKSNGDKALFELTEKLDRCSLSSLKVSGKEVEEAFALVDKEIIETFEHIKKNLEKFYSCEKPKEWSVCVDKGINSGMVYRPYQRVGVYVPGGNALYPTIVLRICVPALVAGVKNIVLCSPPDQNGKIPAGVLISAKILGIKEIYKLGGAQAVGAMAYGTETIKPVQKISAVGSVYVTTAIKLLYGIVSIDRLAGPSDGMVLADSSANPELVAANMLVETEHGPVSGTAVLVPSMDFALKVEDSVKDLLVDCPEKPKAVFQTALYDNSAILVYKDLEEAIDFVNEYAPEHLQLTVSNPEKVIERLQNVGAIQNGEFSVISSGDFFGGTANVLPTGGLAKIFSDISVCDFLKKIPVQNFSKEGFMSICEKAEKLANYQRMYYHAKAISIRKKI